MCWIWQSSNIFAYRDSSSLLLLGRIKPVIAAWRRWQWVRSAFQNRSINSLIPLDLQLQVFKRNYDQPLDELPSAAIAKLRLDDVLKSHNIRFIRACCHISTRLERELGQCIPLSYAIRTEQYGLSPSGFYDSAFMDESFEETDHPIREILDKKLPRSAQRIWQKDFGALFELTTPLESPNE